MVPHPSPHADKHPRPTRRAALQWAAWGLAASTGASPAQDKRPLKFVYGDNQQPLSYVDNGVLRGGLPRVMEELLNHRLRLDVVHQAYPWARAQALVQQGEADGFVSSATAERLQYTVANEEWLAQAKLTAFARADNAELASFQKLQTLVDLSDYKLGFILGNNWAESVLGSMPALNASSREIAFRMLLAGRFDLLIDVSSPTQLALRAAKLDLEIKELPLVLAREDVRVCVGKNSPLLVHLHSIDETIRSMRSDGTLARLFRP